MTETGKPRDILAGEAFVGLVRKYPRLSIEPQLVVTSTGDPTVSTYKVWADKANSQLLAKGETAADAVLKAVWAEPTQSAK